MAHLGVHRFVDALLDEAEDTSIPWLRRTLRLKDTLELCVRVHASTVLALALRGDPTPRLWRSLAQHHLRPSLGAWLELYHVGFKSLPSPPTGADTLRRLPGDLAAWRNTYTAAHQGTPDETRSREGWNAGIDAARALASSPLIRDTALLGERGRTELRLPDGDRIAVDPLLHARDGRLFVYDRMRGRAVSLVDLQQSERVVDRSLEGTFFALTRAREAARQSPLDELLFSELGPLRDNVDHPREEAVSHLLGWCRAPTGKPLLVVGPAGQGKTAVMAEVAHRLLAGPEELAVAAVFFRRTGANGLSGSELVTTIWRQLAERLPALGAPPMALDPATMLHQLAAALHAQDPIAVVLADGLDEADAGDRELLRRLAGSASVLGATRPLRAELDWPSWTLPPLSGDEVRRLLDDVLPEGFRDRSWLEEVRKAEPTALFVRHVRDDIAAGRLTPGTSDLPTSFADAVSAEVRQLDRTAPELAEVLLALTRVRRGVTTEELAVLSGQPQQVCERFLDTFPGWVGSAGAGRVRLEHDARREVLEQGWSRRIHAATERLVDALPDCPCAYAVEYGLVHLLADPGPLGPETERCDRAWELFLDRLLDEQLQGAPAAPRRSMELLLGAREAIWGAEGLREGLTRLADEVERRPPLPRLRCLRALRSAVAAVVGRAEARSAVRRWLGESVRGPRRAVALELCTVRAEFGEVLTAEMNRQPDEAVERACMTWCHARIAARSYGDLEAFVGQLLEPIHGLTKLLRRWRSVRHRGNVVGAALCTRVEEDALRGALWRPFRAWARSFFLLKADRGVRGALRAGTRATLRRLVATGVRRHAEWRLARAVETGAEQMTQQRERVSRRGLMGLFDASPADIDDIELALSWFYVPNHDPDTRQLSGVLWRFMDIGPSSTLAMVKQTLAGAAMYSLLQRSVSWVKAREIDRWWEDASCRNVRMSLLSALGYLAQEREEVDDELMETVEGLVDRYAKRDEAEITHDYRTLGAIDCQFGQLAYCEARHGKRTLHRTGALLDDAVNGGRAPLGAKVLRDLLPVGLREPDPVLEVLAPRSQLGTRSDEVGVAWRKTMAALLQLQPDKAGAACERHEVDEDLVARCWSLDVRDKIREHRDKRQLQRAWNWMSINYQELAELQRGVFTAGIERARANQRAHRDLVLPRDVETVLLKAVDEGFTLADRVLGE